VVGYGVYVNGVAAGAVSRFTIETASWRGYALSGLACGRSYSFAVDAYDAAGNHSKRASATGSTAPCPQQPEATGASHSPVDSTAPSRPSWLAAMPAGKTSFSLSWSTSSDNVGVVGYGVYVNGTAIGTAHSRGYTLGGLTCGRSYSFAVDAYDAAGNHSSRASVTGSTAPCFQPPATAPGPGHNETPSSPSGPPVVPERHTSSSPEDVLPPTSPLGVGIIGAGATGVALEWSTSSDNVAVVGYGVYENGVSVGSTASTDFTISGLACATTYTFAVDAFDAAGNRSARTEVSGSTAPCPTGASADLFVAPTTASPAGSDTNPCTQAAPCQTFGRAYIVAVPGQTVEIGSGSYPYQRLAYDAGKTSAHVVFKPAPGASVNVAQIDFGQAQLTIPAAQHVTVRDMAVGYLRAWDGTADVEWRNIAGRTFEILSNSGSPYPPSSNVSVIGGTFGPCQAPRDEGCTTKLIGNNLLVDGATIFGSTSSDLANYHADGMFIRGCRGCTVRRTKFRGNMVTHVRIQDCCGLQASQNVTLENNWFSAPVDRDGSSPRGDAIDVDNPIQNLLIRNNSFAENTGVIFGNGNFSGTRLVGNLMMNFPCVAGVGYSYNLFIPLNPTGWGVTACGSTDRKVTSFGYVSGGGFDYHLAAGSPASGAGSPGDCPANDIDGQGRPNPCSAGSDER